MAKTELDNAIKTGNLLQYIAQPALLTAASYCFYKYNKTYLTQSSVATMLIVNSLATYFFASKAIEPFSKKVLQNRIYIPLGSTVFSMLLSFAKGNFRIEGKLNEAISRLAPLGMIYVLTSLVIDSMARQAFRRAIEKSLGEGINDIPVNAVVNAIRTISAKIIPQYGVSGPNRRQPTKEEFRILYHRISLDQKAALRHALSQSGIRLFNESVFKLNSYPGYIFKKVTRSDFEVLITHQCICQCLKLSELFIPQSKFFEVNGVTFMAQKAIEYNAEDQPLHYLTQAERIEQAVLQLTTYILETGETDVEWRNMPIIGDIEGGEPLKIALIDHDFIPNDRPEWGIIGNEQPKRRGLIGLLCEQQARKVAALYQRSFWFHNKAIDQALAKRVAELKTFQAKLESEKKFKEWATKNNRFFNWPIQNTNEEILVTFNSLLAERDPNNFFFVHELRTVTMEKRYANDQDESSQFSLLTEQLALLKELGFIYDFTLYQFGTDSYGNPIMEFTITA